MILVQTNDITHSNLYTEQLLCAHALTQRERFVHRATFAQLGKNALFRRTCTVAVGTVRLFALPDPLHLVSFPSLRHLVSLKVIVLAANTVECQGHGQSWEIAYLPVCVSVLMHTSAVSK